MSLVEPGKAQSKEKLTPQETAAYLRQLADDLDAGRISLDQEEMELCGEVKVKQSLKLKENKSSLKLKLKIAVTPPEFLKEMEEAAAEPEPAESQAAPAEAATPQEAEGQESAEDLPSYKKLKKEMAKQFKTVKDSLEQGQLPEEDLVESFVENCRLMTIYPDKGEEYYPQFSSAIRAFKFAVENGNLENAQSTAAEINQFKKDCHGQYK